MAEDDAASVEHRKTCLQMLIADNQLRPRTKGKTRRGRRRKGLGEATRRIREGKGEATTKTQQATGPPPHLPGRQRTPVLGADDPEMFHQFCTGVLCYSEHLYDINEDKDYRNEEMYFRDFYERVWGLGLTHIKPEAFWEEFWF